jgi:hypothetical protein
VSERRLRSPQTNLTTENIMIAATIILAGIVIVTAWDSSEKS